MAVVNAQVFGASIWPEYTLDVLVAPVEIMYASHC
jgi:hypothetical protein